MYLGSTSGPYKIPLQSSETRAYLVNIRHLQYSIALTSDRCICGQHQHLQDSMALASTGASRVNISHLQVSIALATDWCNWDQLQPLTRVHCMSFKRVHLVVNIRLLPDTIALISESCINGQHRTVLTPLHTHRTGAASVNIRLLQDSIKVVADRCIWDQH